MLKNIPKKMFKNISKKLKNIKKNIKYLKFVFKFPKNVKIIFQKSVAEEFT